MTTDRSAPRCRGSERGSSLLEVLVALVILGMVGIGVLYALAGSIRVSVWHRTAADGEVVGRTFAEALGDAAYVPCAQPSDYQGLPGFSAPNHFAVTVTAVTSWTGDANQATFQPFGAGCQTMPIDPNADTGLQQVTYRVTHTAQAGAPVDYHRTLTTLKYFDGNTASLDRIPKGAVRCTIGGADVSDATIDQAQPAVNLGTQPTIDATEASGKSPAQARRTLLKVNEVAGTTRCIGPNDNAPGGVLPGLSSNLVVERAQLTLYDWRITGSPACPDQCQFVLDRPTASWSESAVTWASAPTVVPGRVLFNRVQANGDYSPSFQQIRGAGLTADVQSFYGSQSANPVPNYGWLLSESCPPAHPTSTGCATQAPGFQFRSHEWKQASQRPSLELILAPRTTAAVQLRNTGSGLCASVKNDDGNSNGAPLLALSCNGKSYEGWINTTSISQFQSLATIDNAANRRCIDVQQSRSNPRSAVTTWSCNTGALWQQLRIDGSAIKVKQTVNGSSIDQCLEVERPTVAGTTSLVGTRLIVNDCDGNPSQQWSVEPQQGAPPAATTPFRLRDVQGNSCADIEVGKAQSPPYWGDGANGVSAFTSKVEQYPCMGASSAGAALRLSQTWRFDGYDRIVDGRDQSACLNAGDGNASTIVTVNYCSNLANEQWAIETKGGTYRIHSVLNGNCLVGGYDAAQLQVRPCVDTDQRQWWAIEAPSAPATAVIGWMRNEGSFNSCMEPQNGQAVSHQAPVWTWPCTSDHPQQEFIRFHVGATQVQYRPTANPTLCLDTYGGGDGTNVHYYNCWVQDPTLASAGATSQSWTLQANPDLTTYPPVADTASHRMAGVDSGRCEEAVTDGALVVAHTCDANNAYQRWIFEPMGIVHQQNVQLRSALRPDAGCLAPETRLINDSGSTFIGDGGQDYLSTWPCLGSAQPAESFIRLTTGQIRLGNDVAFCIDSRNNTTGTIAYIHTTCHLGYQETWKYTQVAGTNPTRQLIQNITYNICLKAGATDTATVTIATCDPNDLAQNWYVQDFGSTVDAGRVGHLRDTATTNCIEQDQTGSLSNGRSLWGWPCAGSTRSQQSYVLLNNGQIRPTVDPSFCLDDNGGTITTDVNSHATLNKCDSTKVSQQTWGADVAGVRQAVVSTGTSAQGYPQGYLRTPRMASAAASSCLREIDGPTVRFGTGSLSGLGIPNNSAFWVGAYAFTRPNCTVAPVANLTYTFEPLTTRVAVQKQIRLGMRSDSGCVEAQTTATDSQFWSWPCTASTRAAQQFVMQYDASGNVQIVNPINGYCMDGRNVAVNDTPYWHSCHSDLNQRWTPVPVPNNSPFVELKNAKAGTNLCLLGDLDTTLLKLTTCDGTFATKAQWFTIENVGATVNAQYVELKDKQSGWCMTPSAGSVGNGRTVVSFQCDALAISRAGFLVTNTGQLRSVENPNYCLDFHHSGEPDTYLLYWTCHDQNNRDTEKSQRWLLTPSGPTTTPPTGMIQRFWDTTKCIRETTGATQPFSVVACLPETDPNAPLQRWVFVPVTP